MRAQIKKSQSKKKESVPKWLNNIINNIEDNIKLFLKDQPERAQGLIIARNIINQETTL